MSMSDGAIRDLLMEVRDGVFPVEGLAEVLRRMPAEPPEPELTLERSLADSGRMPSGSAFEISRAYHLGWLDQEQYEVLCRAIGERSTDAG